MITMLFQDDNLMSNAGGDDQQDEPLQDVESQRSEDQSADVDLGGGDNTGSNDLGGEDAAGDGDEASEDTERSVGDDAETSGPDNLGAEEGGEEDTGGLM
jgi:hypothetical protein